MADIHKERMTKQREIVLEELRKTRMHPTADELYERVRKRLPKISLATVYRNLEWLAEREIIRKIEHTGSSKRFDADMDDHFHIFCVECGRVDDFPVESTLKDAYDVHIQTDYRVLGHRTKWFGICPQCQRKEKNTNEKHDG